LPVRIGGLMVNQGELLHADANGVTSIPVEIASEVSEVADKFVAAEALMLDYVKAPGPKNRARYDELRKQFQSVVADLTKQVSRKR